MSSTKRPSAVMTGLMAVVALMLALVAVVPVASAQEIKPGRLSLALSRSADRADPVPLDGATVAPGESLAIFVTPIDAEADRVRFFINSRAVRSDFRAPWDLGGTTSSGSAIRIPAEQLMEGDNTVTARVTAGPATTILSATVTLAPSPPPPRPPVAPGGGAVVGVVSLAGGGGVAGVVVDLFGAAADGSRGGYLGSATTGGDGGYRLEAVPGCYVLVFVGPGVSSSSPLVWQASGGVFLEVRVCVDEGQTPGDVNAVLVDPSGPPAPPVAPGGGAVVGVVSLAGGGGVAGVVVDLFGAAADGSRGGYLGSATTGGDGGYRLEAVPGCYVLVFIAPEGALWDPAQAPFLQINACVDEAATLTGVNATLADTTEPPVSPVGLRAWYPFDRSTNDTSGSGNNAQANGPITYTVGLENEAAVLGGDGYLSLPQSFLQEADQLTISTWVYWQGGGAWQRIFDLGNNTGEYLFLTPASGSGTLRFAIADGGPEQQLNAPGLVADQWTHVAVTLNGSTGQLYVNGQLAAEAPLTLTAADVAPSLNYLGRSQFAADPLYRGLLDDFRIYSEVLSPERIQDLIAQARSTDPGILTPSSALQSSTDFGGDPMRAIDGDTNGVYSAGSVTHTATEQNAWWQADLGNNALIEKVVLFNRTDCCGDRLSDFTVFVSDRDLSNRSYTELLADRAVARAQVRSLNGPTIEIPLPSVGRFVKVQLSSANVLSMAEVMVYGERADRPVAGEPWSAGSTWGGTVPGTGASVRIPAGQTVLLDTDISLRSLVIDGTLICANQDLNVTAEWIMIHGTLQCGTESNPFTNDLTLTLTGRNDGDNIMGMGDKLIGVMDNGRMYLHGEDRKSWVKLGDQASPGATSLRLSEPVDWRPGDQIVIASNRVDYSEAEEHTIVSVSPDRTTINIQQPLVYPRDGQLKNYSRSTDGRSWDVDTRVEVGLLTRNITIQGDAFSETSGTGYGGHIMAMDNSIMSASGVELYRMGQRGILGRYPWHWHLLGQGGQGQYLKNSSVHRSYNRAIVVHGTWYTLVEDNVAYDHIGHGMMLEDGSERFNVFKGNLALVTRRPAAGDAVTPSDRLPFQSIRGSSPATYWITNPNNTFIDNVAAGSPGTGFWYAMPTRPTGASANDPRFQAINPREDAFGQFDGNVSHSNFVGLDSSDLLDSAHAVVEDVFWNSPGQNLHNDLTIFCNRMGIYGGPKREEKLVFQNSVFADNELNLMFASGDVVRDSIFVAYDRERPIDNPFHKYGMTLAYDGRVRMYDSHFVGWDQPKASMYINQHAALKQLNSLNRGITYDQAGPPRIDDVVADLYSGAYSNLGHYDIDGSLTGRPGSTLTNDHPFWNTPGSFKADNWLLHRRINQRMSTVLFNGNADAVFTRLRGNEDRAYYYMRRSGFGNTYLPLIVNDGYEYLVDFINLPRASERNFSITLRDHVRDGDAVILRMRSLGRLGGISVSNARRVGSFDEVRRSSTSTFSSDGTDLLVKLYVGATYTVSWTGSSLETFDSDSDGDGVSNRREVALGQNPADATDGFLFYRQGDFEGWATANVATPSVFGGVLSGVSSTSDPQLIRPGINLQGRAVQGVAVRLKTDSATPVDLYWTTADTSSFGESRRQRAAYTTAGQWQTLVFDLRNVAGWSGELLTGLRLDPTQLATQTFHIAYIEPLSSDAFNPSGDEDGDGTSNAREAAVGRDPYSATDLAFEFTDTLGAWTRGHGAHADIAPDPTGSLRMTTYGWNPEIENKALNFPGREMPVVRVRMRINPQSPSQRVPASLPLTMHWVGQTGGSNLNFFERGTRTLSYTGAGNWQTLEFDMSSDASWMDRRVLGLLFRAATQSVDSSAIQPYVIEIDFIKSAPNNTPVRVYADTDYRGASLGVEIGDYPFSVLAASPVGNDAISSIAVSPGYSITACRDAAGGVCRTYTTSVRSLEADGFNDQISSFTVTRN